MKKKLLFYIDSLMLGGEQKIAIDYIKVLEQDYDITLVVNQDLGEDNFFLSSLPSTHSPQFVVEEETMKQLDFYKKNRRKSFWNRWMYSYYLAKKRRERLRKMKILLKGLSYEFCFDFSNKLPLEQIDERTIIWSHTSLDGLSKKEWKKRKERYERAKKVVVVSENMEKEFHRYFPSLQNKILRIPNFVNLAEIARRAQEEIPEKEEFFLICSRLDPKKDIGSAIRAFSLWKKSGKHPEKLFILGEGEELADLENLVASLSLQEEVFFLGRKENPYAYMKRAKLFLHSSLQEGFGLVLVEAMACGTPVIATDCPVGPREILQGGEVGCLVPMKNPEKMYECIQRLCDKEEEYHSFQRKGYERAQDFDQKKILSILSSVWD